jgi:hypothetical protein
MVTFHDEMRYSDALSAGLAQKKIMDEVMKTPSLITEWQSLDFENIVNQLAPSSQ